MALVQKVLTCYGTLCTSLVMNTWNDILEPWKKPRQLADDIDVNYQAARKMLERKSVAIRHWPKFIEAGRQYGLDLTLEDLAQLKSQEASQ